MITPASLIQYFDEIYALQRGLRNSSVYQHRRALSHFVAWANNPPIKQIDENLISAWVASLEENYAPITRKKWRVTLISTLNHAADAGLCDYPRSRRIRKVKVPVTIPEAWTLDEVHRLIAATKQLRYHGDWFATIIRAAWDTGLRRADLAKIKIDQIGSDGWFQISQNKTQNPLRKHFSQATMDAMRKLRRAKPLTWPGAKGTEYDWWKKLCDIAQVSHGACQKMRRSAASNIAKHHGPLAASEFLGHQDPTLAKKHYIDPRIATGDPPVPEEL